MTSALRNRKISKQNLDSDNDSLFDDDMDDIVKDIESDRKAEANEVPSPPTTRTGKIKGAIKEWGLTCSWHGIPHMADSISRCSIILWMLILCICGVLFVYMILTTVLQFLAYSKTVNLVNQDQPSMFPTITFCNSNPYKLSAVQAIPELAAMLTIYAQSSQ